MGGPKLPKFRLSSPKLRVNFGLESEIRTVFPPKIRWSSKIKKKKVFTEIKIDYSAEIGNSNDFFAQNQVVTKKRSSPKLRVIFQPKSEIRTIFSPKIRWPPKKKKKKVFTKIESGFLAETVSFTVTLLFNYCYVRNY